MKWTLLSTAVALSLVAPSLASLDDRGISPVDDLLLARAVLEGRQATGRCGDDGGGARCPGNLCCSAFGYCGDGDQYCPQIVGCQPQYGWCEGQPLPSPTTSSTSTTPTSTSTSTTSTTTGPTGSGCATVTVTSSITVAGPTTTVTVGGGGGGVITVTSTVSVPYTVTVTGGGVTTSPPVTTPPPTTTTSTTTSRTTTSATVTIPAGMRSSTDGTCGDGVTCLGSAGGQCCSQWGYCGDDRQYCVPLLGCQAQFGRCDSS